ncbi:taste receptor type 2 member 7-like [Suricata suricatta]|uniref:taste receptor type 2 member 7-like n=1 Tax=Suricata suricatta TaxID=37032 RepID=UPI0011555CC0|nr:taste receptor type 2 member 7-like [Suricata suricatta]
MASILKNIFMMLFAGEFLMGILGNGFIILVNCIDWIRNWKFFITDFIISCLAFSRIVLLCIIILGIGLDVICENIWYNHSYWLHFEILWTGSNYFCTTCTTCLSVFYFFKIANFSNPIFLWMKWRIHRVLLIIVLGAVFSFCLSLPFQHTESNSLIKIKVNAERNWTLSSTGRTYELFMSHMLQNIMFFIPFTVSLASFVLLIYSLWSHTRQMKGTGGDPITKVHVRAMKSMILFLLFFFMYYLSTIMMNLTYVVLDSLVAKILANTFVFLYPSAHTFLLIFWNSKLKQASLCVLKKLKCVNLRKPTHP